MSSDEINKVFADNPDQGQIKLAITNNITFR